MYRGRGGYYWKTHLCQQPADLRAISVLGLWAREICLCPSIMSQHYWATSSVFRDTALLQVALCLEVTESHLQLLTLTSAWRWHSP